MKKICLTILLVFAHTTAFAVNSISVTIDGQSYNCSSSGSTAEPQVVSVYCECRESAGIYFQRMAVMSNGTSKVISSTQLTPSNGSYNPDDVRKDCQARVRLCR